jgi:hypothetical protein
MVVDSRSGSVSPLQPCPITAAMHIKALANLIMARAIARWMPEPMLQNPMRRARKRTVAHSL